MSTDGQAKIQKGIEELRARLCGEDIPGDCVGVSETALPASALALHAPLLGEDSMRRYLRARDGDVDKAEVMLRESIAWRESWKEQHGVFPEEFVWLLKIGCCCFL
jgi:hypothetical protein